MSTDFLNQKLKELLLLNIEILQRLEDIEKNTGKKPKKKGKD